MQKDKAILTSPDLPKKDLTKDCVDLRPFSLWLIHPDGEEEDEEESDDLGSEEDDSAATDDYDGNGAQNPATESPTASQSIDNMDIPELTTESYDEDPEVISIKDEEQSPHDWQFSGQYLGYYAQAIAGRS